MSSRNSADALESFTGCHVGILSMVNDLADLPQLMLAVRRFQSIAENIDFFFNEVVKNHHSEEEEQLFPAVLSSATPGEELSEVQRLITRLTSEHRAIETAFAHLIPNIKSFQKNTLSIFNDKAVLDIVDLYTSHASFEEEVFLPLAKAVLSRNDNHMAALGMSIHLRHGTEIIRQQFGAL